MKMSNNKKTQPDSKNTSISTPFETQWSSLKSELQSAVNDWSLMSEKMNEISPEEEQIQKVKNLIHDLKAKLKEFEL